MKYNSPIHIFETDDNVAFRDLLCSFIDSLVSEYDRSTYHMGSDWPKIRQQVAEYKILRDKLHSAGSFNDIEDLLLQNRYEISNAPVVSSKNGQPAFLDLRIRSHSWKFNDGFASINLPIIEMSTYVDAGWGWNVIIEVTVASQSKPRFISYKLAQSLISYGIFVHRAEFIDRNNSGQLIYQMNGFMPGKVWRNLAMLEKLAGNISGSIEFLEAYG